MKTLMRNQASAAALAALCATLLLAPALRTNAPAQIETGEALPDTGPLSALFDPSLFDKITLPDSTIRPATRPRSDPAAGETWHFTLLPTSLQRNPLLVFTIITEMTDEGRKLPLPSFRRPVYYLMTSAGYHVEGGQYGGGTPLQIEQFRRRIIRALASNGYRPADERHLPTQIIRLVWGEHNTIERPMFARRAGFHIRNYKNLLSRAKIVGGDAFARAMEAAIIEQSRSVLPSRSRESPMGRFRASYRGLDAQVYGDRYYLIVQSFDATTYAQNRERVLLWQTNITIPATGVSLEQTMPALVTNGAFFFGRETRIPVVVTKRPIESQVEIGEAAVVEYLATPATPPAGTQKKTKGNAR